MNAAGASALLTGLWRDGAVCALLPPELCPANREEAYAVQALVEAAGFGPRRGWKIAATSAAGQAHINVDGPLAGRILAGRMVPYGAPVPLGANRMRVVEVEFAFVAGRTLPPRAEPYRVEEVMDATAALHLGMELPDSRFGDFTAVGAAQLIADNGCADRFVLGPAVQAPWRDADLAGHAVRAVHGGGPVHEGRGGNALGDPRLALCWLVNELSRHGTALLQGEFVTTGTCVVPVPVEPGDVVTGDYGAFGTMAVAFSG